MEAWSGHGHSDQMAHRHRPTRERRRCRAWFASLPNSLASVELIYAVENKMTYRMLKKASGKYNKSSTEGLTAPAAAAAKTMPADYRVSITNAPGADSYPISSFTWLLIPTHATDPAKAKVLADFVGWMLDHGEGEAAALTYAPLPKPVQDMVRKSIASIK